MKLSRRKFLIISAAAACPTGAHATTWQGRAFGSDISLAIRAPRDLADAAIARTRSIIANTEALFSLYAPQSTLSQLNRDGVLKDPPAAFGALMKVADTAHILTGGGFDPTVQPLWQALATGQDIEAARARIGWHRVHFGPNKITIAAGQALTFNGIAQGFATDEVTKALSGLGLTDVLVNMGEHRALGGPWRLGLSDPDFGRLGQQTLFDRAVATSSVAALRIGAESHILHPDLTPRWSTVSVTARTAVLADSLSTGLTFAPLDVVGEVATHPDVSAIRLIDTDGNLSTL